MANGYLGLTKSINDRESANREIAVLDQMEQKQQMEQNQNMQAQIMQEQMYAKMYEQADGLLGKDRKRINKQIKMAQKQVQGALDQYGASKSKFLANGGVSILGQMETDILQSDEAIRYKDNKENLTRILEMQAKGLGHLLSPNDLQSVEDYHANEDGATITFSGVMSEVEIPHDKFALDEEINPYYIMNHNANMIKILGNYAKVYPDRPEPEMDENGRPTPKGRAQILAFMKRMGYGGMGQNATLFKQNLAKKAAEDEAKKAESKTTVLNTINQLDRMTGDLTISKLTPEFMDQFMQKDGNNAFRDLFGETNSAMSRRRDFALDPTGDPLGETIDYFGQDLVGLRGSKKLAIAKADQNDMISKHLGVKIEDNKITNFDVDGEMYASDGTQIKKHNRFKAEDYGKNFEVLGLVTGFKSAVSNGKEGESEPQLLINAYNDDGTLDKKATDKLYQKRYGGDINTPARLSYFVAMKGEDDDIIYKEVPMDKTAIRQSLADAYKSNDITETVAEEKRNDQYRLNTQKMTQEEQFEYEDFKSKSMEVFKDPMFEQEAAKYYGAGSGGQLNRSDMMKAFYMAYETEGAKMAQADPAKGKERMTKAVDSDTFSAFMEQADLVNDLKDYNKHPEEIIGKFLVNMNRNLEPGSMDAKAYQKIAMKWKQILDTL